MMLASPRGLSLVQTQRYFVTGVCRTCPPTSPSPCHLACRRSPTPVLFSRGGRASRRERVRDNEECKIRAPVSDPGRRWTRWELQDFSRPRPGVTLSLSRPLPARTTWTHLNLRSWQGQFTRRNQNTPGRGDVAVKVSRLLEHGGHTDDDAYVPRRWDVGSVATMQSTSWAAQILF